MTLNQIKKQIENRYEIKFYNDGNINLFKIGTFHCLLYPKQKNIHQLKIFNTSYIILANNDYIDVKLFEHMDNIFYSNEDYKMYLIKKRLQQNIK